MKKCMVCDNEARNRYGSPEAVCSDTCLDKLMRHSSEIGDNGIEYHTAGVEVILDGGVDCPLPLEVIPNYLGINLVSVDRISWSKLPDGQLTDLTIHFIPDLE